jgi:uncharacterized protein (TIGR02996 family)
MYPEADALLDAIFDHPDEDTPRLVYADWLQEHGHEDYAQFIRLSIQAEGGSKPPRVRQQFREERFPYWQRMQAHTEAFRILPVTIHDYDRGICTNAIVKAEDFVRTAATWWPFITPPDLTVFAVTGREAEVMEAVDRHSARLRKFRCLSRPGMDVHDIDEYSFPPLAGSVFAAFAAPGFLAQLRSLDVTIAYADIPALRTFIGSDLIGRLRAAYVRVRFPGTFDFKRITLTETEPPDSLRVALEELLVEHS